MCNSTLSCFARNLIENLKTSIISDTHSSGSVTDLPGGPFSGMHPFLGDKWGWRGIEFIPSPNLWIWWNGTGDRKSASDASLYKPDPMYFWKHKKLKFKVHLAFIVCITDSTVWSQVWRLNIYIWLIWDITVKVSDTFWSKQFFNLYFVNNVFKCSIFYGLNFSCK